MLVRVRPATVAAPTALLRLLRRELLHVAALVPPTVREERLAEFGRAFPRLGAHTLGAFDRFFGGRHVTHAALVAFACGEER